jgi:hypothetical protein
VAKSKKRAKALAAKRSKRDARRSESQAQRDERQKRSPSKYAKRWRARLRGAPVAGRGHESPPWWSPWMERQFHERAAA